MVDRVGSPLPDTPRTDPSEPDLGTGLPPGVFDGKALVWPRVLDFGWWKPGGGNLCDALPCHMILLAAPPERASPENRDMVAKRPEGPYIRGHRVVGKVQSQHIIRDLAR